MDILTIIATFVGTWTAITIQETVQKVEMFFMEQHLLAQILSKETAFNQAPKEIWVQELISRVIEEAPNRLLIIELGKEMSSLLSYRYEFRIRVCKQEYILVGEIMAIL